MYKIVWSDIAKDTHQQILDFILENWSIDVAIKHNDNVNFTLKRLEKQQYLCPKLKGYEYARRCVLSKQISLLYRINAKDKTIELLTFFDNRANHLH